MPSPPEFEFLAVADQFQLGDLNTEQCHPKTTGLSEWAQQDLSKAIKVLWEVDQDALRTLEDRFQAIVPLAEAIHVTLREGDRVFLCGCGATGRLSIALEVFARQGLLNEIEADRIVGFMAGGDAALIRSIERFEDVPAYGERQLIELGFRDGDLLIGSTEGGETPFVIGATETAAGLSRRPPFFLYGNPDPILREKVERSRRVLDNDAIRKLNLSVGPMALSGSTRMQSSTVIMAAIGFALTYHRNPDKLTGAFQHWRAWIQDFDPAFLEPFILAESSAYAEDAFVIYEPARCELTVLTDTTERSPTFSLVPFEREGVDEPPSLCYLSIPRSRTPAESWRQILHRDPRPLDWGERTFLTGAEAIRRFDFSNGILPRRLRRTECRPHHVFRLGLQDRSILWDFRDARHVISLPQEIDLLGANLFLKMLLNIHSTLVAGRMGRYVDNLMTYVSASNFKLIDRSTRYVRILLRRYHQLDVDYETVARQVLTEKERLAPGEPIVLKTVDALVAKAMSKGLGRK